MSRYNDMGFVDPRGKFHSTDGLSHPDWAHEHRALVGFVGTKDDEYKAMSGEAAIFDDEGRTALDYFKDEGWIRVKPDAGVEVDGVHPGNVHLIKAILRDMARENHGQTLYVDDGGSSRHVRVSWTGRPDFSEIDRSIGYRHGRYSR